MRHRNGGIKIIETPPPPSPLKGFTAIGSSRPHCSFGSSDEDKTKKPLFLHVGPSGDCWTGSSIFAAKHLQPDYVKSVPLPEEAHICLETLIEVLEDDIQLAQGIYDTEILPETLLDQVRAAMKEKEE